MAIEDIKEKLSSDDNSLLEILGYMEEDKGDLFILTISIDKYKYFNFTSQNNPKDETKLLIDIFKKKSKIKNKNIYSLINENATKLDIFKVISDISTRIKEDDCLFIYLSGCGEYIDHSLFFIPYNGRETDIFSLIPYATIHASMANINCKYFLLTSSLLKTFKYKILYDPTKVKAIRLSNYNKREIKPEIGSNLYNNFAHYFNNLNSSKKMVWLPYRNNQYGNMDSVSTAIGENLKELIKYSYIYLYQLILSGDINKCLQALKFICLSNDIELLKKILTIEFVLKLTENLKDETDNKGINENFGNVFFSIKEKTIALSSINFYRFDRKKSQLYRLLSKASFEESLTDWLVDSLNHPENKYYEYWMSDSIKFKSLYDRGLGIPTDDEKYIISELTSEIIEEIKNRGFYLIKPLETKDNFKEKLKIIFTSANPRNNKFLRLRNEVHLIHYELLKAKLADKFELIKFNSLTIDELQDILLTSPPSIFHFSGHGNCEGIFLIDQDDLSLKVSNEAIANLFKLFENEISCLFLNSCYSKYQSVSIVNSVKKVICMSSAVPDETAIHFAAAFYKSIGAGKSIEFSFEFAKNSLQLSGLQGSHIPMLMP